jgi:fructokinase
VVSVDPGGQARYEFYVDGTADWQWDAGQPLLPPEVPAVHAGSIAAWRTPGGDRIAGALARVRAAGGVLVSFDPNIRPALQPDAALIDRYLAVAHVVKVSEEDLRWL